MTERSKGETRVKIDNDRVIVHEWCLAPGDETGWHRHNFDYVIIPQTTGSLLLEADGGDNTVNLELGSPYFKNAGVAHNTVNPNDFDFKFIEVEVK